MNIVQADESIVKVSFIIFIFSFVFSLTQPTIVSDPSGPDSFVFMCASNMFMEQSQLLDGPEKDTAISGECGIFRLPQGRVRGGEYSGSICPLSGRNEYYFLFFTQKSSNNARKRYDMYCPTHGFLSEIVENYDTFPDFYDFNKNRYIKDYLGKFRTKRFDRNDQEKDFIKICSERGIAPPAGVEFRDEKVLYQQAYDGVMHKNAMAMMGGPIVYYSFLIFFCSGIVLLALKSFS